MPARSAVKRTQYAYEHFEWIRCHWVRSPDEGATAGVAGGGKAQVDPERSWRRQTRAPWRARESLMVLLSASIAGQLELLPLGRA